MVELAVSDVVKRFGGLPAVDGVTFGVDQGEIVALVGPNGAGKSTLLRTICGLGPATSGAIQFRDREVTRLSANKARTAGIAMVLQAPRPFESMSVIDNVALGAMFGSVDGSKSVGESLDQAETALAFVGLAERRDAPISSLNLHEQRFIDLARALAGRPRLLLLDEVMAGLNETELEESIAIVRQVRDELGVTVIWVEHVMKAVMTLAERVLVLNFGRLIADGRPEEVMRRDDVVAAYLGERHGSGGGRS
jgi:ABC-type branched-subunit amino acid transport system ATPase component